MLYDDHSYLHAPPCLAPTLKCPSRTLDRPFMCFAFIVAFLLLAFYCPPLSFQFTLFHLLFLLRFPLLQLLHLHSRISPTRFPVLDHPRLFAPYMLLRLVFERVRPQRVYPRIYLTLNSH